MERHKKAIGPICLNFIQARQKGCDQRVQFNSERTARATPLGAGGNINERRTLTRETNGNSIRKMRRTWAQKKTTQVSFCAMSARVSECSGGGECAKLSPKLLPSSLHAAAG
jgi:hypothetical protein